MGFDFLISSMRILEKEVGLLLALIGTWQECDYELAFGELLW